MSTETETETKETPLIVQVQEIFDNNTPEDIANNAQHITTIVTGLRAARESIRAAEATGERINSSTAKKKPKKVENLMNALVESV